MTSTPAGDSANALTVSQALAKLLRAYGAEYVFTLTGAPQDPLIEMQNHEGVRVVLGRSERSALAMADAYARVTGKPTFGIVQFGPGATYLPASIIDAFWASSPLIAISGTTTTKTRYRYEYQELEQTSMFPAMTKWAGDLPQPERIADVLRTAVRASVSGVPGPSYLGIPADWFGKKLTIPQDIYAEPAFLRTPALRVAPVAQDVERAIALLASAEKPVLIAGGGVILSEAWQELTALAEALNIPVVTTMAGKGSIADTHPLAVGVCGRYSRKVANDTLAGADFCLAIGTKLSSMGTNVFQYPGKGTRIVHIDLDPNSLGRTYREELSIVGGFARSAENVARSGARGARERQQMGRVDEAGARLGRRMAARSRTRLARTHARRKTQSLSHHAPHRSARRRRRYARRGHRLHGGVGRHRAAAKESGAQHAARGGLARLGVPRGVRREARGGTKAARLRPRPATAASATTFPISKPRCA